MQYTIRNVPPAIDRAIKIRAKQLGKSVNELALEALAMSIDRPMRRRSLRRMPGAWSGDEARRFNRFLERQRSIDPELWK